MTPQLRRFCSEAILLLAAVLTLAAAEDVWWYVGVAVLGVGVGFWSIRFGGRPVLSTNGGRVFVLLAFAYLLLEWSLVTRTPPVLILSHFLVLVCVSKWLHPRTPRDDMLFPLLLLLLLTVTAIVGEMLFPIVLALYLTIGVNLLVRQHLEAEAARAARRNQQIQGAPSPEDRVSPLPTIPGTGRATVLLALVALSVGSIVFVLTPRVGAGMLGQVPSPIARRAIGGFARTVDFNSIGTIAESEQPVMRVVVTNESGEPVSPDQPLYFRGAVLERYSYRASSWNRGWGWRRGERGDSGTRLYELALDDSGQRSATLLDESENAYLGPSLIQRYYLEANEGLDLFACYPPIEITCREELTVRKSADDQIIQLVRPARKMLQYVIRTPAMSANLVRLLADERGSSEPPAVIPPDPPLDRQAEILDLIDRRTAGIGPLDNPPNRMDFVRRLEAYLQSSAFTYTLTPPPMPDRGDPVSEFLLTTHRGHCEYFASALALMCQLKGVPARLVTGYCSGDYNTFGHFYVVRQKHAHAWVEVFIPGTDWVVFDPTPSRSRQPHGVALWGVKLRWYLDYLQFRWTGMVLSFDSASRREIFEQFGQWLRKPAQQDQRTIIGVVGAFIRELFGWRLELSWRERLIYWVFAILVTALVILIGYVVFTLARWTIAAALRRYQSRSSERGYHVDAEFYHRFCRRLASLGLHRPADQTPAEFALDLAARYAAFGEAPELVRAYYEVAFGGRPLPAARRTRLEDFLTRLRHLDQAHLNRVHPDQAHPEP